MISNEALERLVRGYDEPLSISTLAGELIATRNQLGTARNESSLLRERARHYDRDWSSIRGELDSAKAENAALKAECDRLTAMLGPQKPMKAEEVTEPGFYWWKTADRRGVIVIARYDDSKIVIKTILGDEIFIGKFIGPLKMREAQ